MKGAYIITYVGKGVNMEYYYLSAIKEDVKNYIDDEITISDFSDRDELENYLNDELWTCDSVTGNASGSYTMNRLTARDILYPFLSCQKSSMQPLELSDCRTLTNK